jgi:hypothetical protein
MWLADERYWILHSNDPLRKFIGDELPKKIGNTRTFVRSVSAQGTPDIVWQGAHTAYIRVHSLFI